MAWVLHAWHTYCNFACSVYLIYHPVQCVIIRNFISCTHFHHFVTETFEHSFYIYSKSYFESHDSHPKGICIFPWKWCFGLSEHSEYILFLALPYKSSIKVNYSNISMALYWVWCHYQLFSCIFEGHNH